MSTLAYSSRLIVGLVLIGLISGCVEMKSETIATLDGSASSQSLESKADVPALATDKSSETQASDEPAFVMQELPQLRSPFTQERVVKLNAIVKKSLDIITKFDELRKSLQADGASSSEFGIALKKLSSKASDARAEMAQAKLELENSGEHYNKPIFAAMVKFVDDVDEELKIEISKTAK